LEDKEIVLLSDKEVKVFNNHGLAVQKKVFKVNWDVASAEKAGYEHFMMKEMCEEPKVVRDTVNPRIKDGNIVLDNIRITAEDLKNIRKIFIVACGTAYHAGVVGKYIIEKLARIPVEVDVAIGIQIQRSSYKRQGFGNYNKSVGETIDTLFALRESKKKGARVLSIVNVVGSSIARESDDVLYTWAGPEIAVRPQRHTTPSSRIVLIAWILHINWAE